MTHSLMEGARNFRDIGGYATTDGGTVRTGLVFRSDRLAGLTDADMVRFSDLGIKTVIDFRPEMERDLTGHDRLPAGVRYITCEIGDAAMAPEVRRSLQRGDFTALPDLEDGNRRLIREFAQELGAALRTVSDPDNLPLVFHCIGGKDRTGMAAALLLTILGVPLSEVRHDYLLSNNAVGPDPNAQQAFFNRFLQRTSRTDELTHEERRSLERFFILEDGYFEAAWDEIATVAGSFEAYVHDELGLSENQIGSLRRVLAKDRETR